MSGPILGTLSDIADNGVMDGGELDRLLNAIVRQGDLLSALETRLAIVSTRTDEKLPETEPSPRTHISSFIDRLMDNNSHLTNILDKIIL